MRSAAGVIKDTSVVNWKDTSGTIQVDKNTVRISPRATTQVQNGTGPSVYPISKGIHNIDVSVRYIITQEVRNAEPLDAFINRFFVEHRIPTPSWI